MADGDGTSFEAGLDGLPVAADPEHAAARDDVELLVSRFADEIRTGAAPTVEAYVARNPALAAQLRELLPLVASLERWKLDKEIECLRRNLPQDFPVRRLGGYELVRELGRGGMGIVFEALHARTGRRVAIKVLPWRVAADLARWQERFRTEAATIARLRHLHIVPVYSFGESEGYCYYVMQYIEGVSLDRVIRSFRERGSAAPAHAAGTADATDPLLPNLRADDWARFAAIGAQAALALEYAHRRGVLHNDIKPANLLIDRAAQVTVTDFAIARRAGGDAASRENLAAPGTFRYLAPERVAGHSDARSDVYALGVTLYELVTRVPAFDSRDHQILLQQILSATPRHPRRLDARIPRPLEAVVLKAMAKAPADRYPSSAALADDLLRFVNGDGVTAPRPGILADMIRRLRHGRSER